MPHPLRRTPHHVIAAGLLGLLALLPGCASSGPAPAGGAAATAIRLAGAGSTFDAAFFTRAFARYQRDHPGVAISYAAVGSSAGITRFKTGQVNFGATEIPATPADLGVAGAGTVQVPVDLGAVSIPYNILTLTNTPLRLTGPVLARIFLGQITRWNDPAITALNPGAGLPDAYITVVHRSDGSGTTYIFSNYLSSVSPAWAAKVGTGRSLHWPAGYGAYDNKGVATAITRIPYSIGYAEPSNTGGTSLGRGAAIANRDGNFVTPAPATIAADAAAKPAITPADSSIVNQPGPAAFPICGYSWVLISARQASHPAGKALVAMVSWLTHAGQADAAAVGYAPLPPAIQRYAHASLVHVTGPAGEPLTR